MKGLAEINAENDALAARAEAKRKASLRRLHDRVRLCLLRGAKRGDTLGDLVADVSTAIDAWDAAERRKELR